MAAHKHASLIKAKADNMELAVFMKPIHSDEWYKVQDGTEIPAFLSDAEYFLCLPKHKEVVFIGLTGVKCIQLTPTPEMAL